MAFAQKPEDAIKYRQGVYRTIGWNFGPMAAMAKGERPYDAAAFARHAEIVAFMSKLPLEGFVPGSDTGETKAKPDIWKDGDKFKAAQERLIGETVKLAQVAKTGDAAALKTQFSATAGACKKLWLPPI